MIATKQQIGIRAKLARWWRQVKEDAKPYPPTVITKEQALDIVRKHYGQDAMWGDAWLSAERRRDVWVVCTGTIPMRYTTVSVMDGRIVDETVRDGPR